jgi:hypothetical protein
MKLQLEMLKQSPEIDDLKSDVHDMEKLVNEYLDFARGDDKEKINIVNINKFLIEKIISYYLKMNHNISYETKIADDFESKLINEAVDILLHVRTAKNDKLEKFNPTDPSKIMRIMINLSDWEPGHFMQYGNFNHTRWRIGDIYTFDWRHVPHSSANASLKPRVSLLTTGVVGAKTQEFLNLARNQREISLCPK